MNLKMLLNGIITVLLLVGVYGASGLVLEEIKTGNGCPKIWVIPACVIILLCFIVPLIVHFIGKFNNLYFVFTGFAFAIAIIASIMQFNNIGECPKLSNGTPMCYLSFLMFFTLISLKILSLKLKKSDKKNV
jgi:hypothetical protein